MNLYHQPYLTTQETKLEKLYFTDGKKIPLTFEARHNLSDNAIRLGKDGPFMVTEADGNVTVYYNKASKGGADAWLTNVDPQVFFNPLSSTTDLAPFAAYVKSFGRALLE